MLLREAPFYRGRGRVLFVASCWWNRGWTFIIVGDVAFKTRPPLASVQTLWFIPCSLHSDLGSQTAKDFFESVQVRLRHVTSLNPVSKQQTLKTAIQDLKHVKSIDSLLSAGAECLCLYLQCKLMIVQAQQDKMWTVPAALCTHQSSGLKSLVENILSTSYRVEHTFTGLDSQQIFLLRQLRLIAHALQILVTQRSSRTNERNLNSMLQVWESFLNRIKTFSNFINTENINTDAFCAEVVSFPGFFESNITNPAGVVDYIQSIMLSHEVPCLELHSSLSQASAVLNEPRGGSDNPLCFSAGLTLGVNVEAILENVPDATKVKVQVGVTLQSNIRILVKIENIRRWFCSGHD